MWIFEGNEIHSLDDMPDGAIGFIYTLVTNDGREYVGRKNLISTTWREVSENVYRKEKAAGEEVKKTKNKTKSKKGKIVWRYKKKVVKETDWKTYTGSNNRLNSEIKKGLGITKYITDFGFSKREMTYLEEKALYCNGVLEHGDKYFNDNIAGRHFKKHIEEFKKNRP